MGSSCLSASVSLNKTKPLHDHYCSLHPVTLSLELDLFFHYTFSLVAVISIYGFFFEILSHLAE